MLKDVPTYKLVKELELRRGVILIALEPSWLGNITRKNKRDRKTALFTKKEDIAVMEYLLRERGYEI